MSTPGNESKPPQGPRRLRTTAQPAGWADPNLDLNNIYGAYGIHSDSSRSIFSYLRGILERKLIVVLCMVLGLAAAAFYIHRTPPYFVSRATIEVENLAPSRMGLGDLYPFYMRYDLFYKTQIRALKSRDVAEEYLRRMGLLPQDDDTKSEGKDSEKEAPVGSVEESGKETKEDLSREARKEALINSVLAHVTVRPIANTQLIEITMGASDQLQARHRLQVYLDAYLAYARSKKSQMKSRTRTWLKRELKRAEKQLRDSQAELLAFTQKHGLVFVRKGPQAAVTRFDKAGKDLIETKTNRIGLELRARAKASLPSSEVDEEYVRRIKTRLAKLRSEYENKKAIYSPDFFAMVALRTKIKALEKALDDVEQRRLGEALSAAKKREALAREAYEKAKAEAINNNSLAVQYEILSKAVDANSKLYMMMLQRSKQAELDHGIMGNNIVVSSAPTLPLAPLYPRKDRILLIGAILGLFGGMVIAVGLEFVDTTVQTADDLSSGLNLPVLGTVPKFPSNGRSGKGEGKGSPLEFSAYESPSSAFTDAVRIVQNTVSSLLSDKPHPVLCVSSALPMEGKTLLSILLATLFASEDKRVLLVDCDLRKPRVHQLFDLPKTPGLGELVRGECGIEDAICSSSIHDLSVLPAGRGAENPVPLLKNRRFQDLVDFFREEYDTTILDCPPILGVADARIVACHTDGAVLISRAGHTPVEVVRQARDALTQLECTILGIVLNMADRRAAGYGTYGSKYHYHYGYHRQDDGRG